MTEKTTIAMDKKTRVGAITVNEAVRAESGREILSAGAEARATGYEVLADEFRVTVETTFSFVLHTPEDGCFSQKEIIETVRSVPQKGINGNIKAVFFVSVPKCEILPSGEVVATEKIDGWYREESSVEVLLPDESLVCRTKKESVTRYDLATDSLSQPLSDEMRMPIKTILDCSATAVVTDCYPSAGAVRCDGEITVRIVALSDNDQFLSQTFTHPFGTDITAAFDDGATFDAECPVARCAAKISDGDARGILTDVTLDLVVTVSAAAEIELTADCYSVEKEVRPTYRTAAYDARFCTRTIADKTSTQFDAGKTINEVCACLHPALSEAEATFDDGIEVKGSFSATVLCLDEENAPFAKTVTVPFSARYNGDYDCSCDLRPTVLIKSATARLKTATGIEVSIEYAATVRGVGEKTTTYLSDVAVIGDKEPDDAAIVLYPVRPGEDLYDVAKALNARQEVLLQQNPDLTLPLVGGEKILLYREYEEKP